MAALSILLELPFPPWEHSSLPVRARILRLLAVWPKVGRKKSFPNKEKKLENDLTVKILFFPRSFQLCFLPMDRRYKIRRIRGGAAALYGGGVKGRSHREEVENIRKPSWEGWKFPNKENLENDLSVKILFFPVPSNCVFSQWVEDIKFEEFGRGRGRPVQGGAYCKSSLFLLGTQLYSYRARILRLLAVWFASSSNPILSSLISYQQTFHSNKTFLPYCKYLESLRELCPEIPTSNKRKIRITCCCCCIQPNSKKSKNPRSYRKRVVFPGGKESSSKMLSAAIHHENTAQNLHWLPDIFNFLSVPSSFYSPPYRPPQIFEFFEFHIFCPEPEWPSSTFSSFFSFPEQKLKAGEKKSSRTRKKKLENDLPVKILFFPVPSNCVISQWTVDIKFEEFEGEGRPVWREE
ncbi:hypothetical protein CEXT_221031 [Caerostris extrusa]|uniref:Uncharacterized protein n=1 Tax=Caerostris extrusa TaxID=172846 RepID=A0AAV4N420_CAEEX|nr:hypothetical protein CEXT_221031 [Caerostris extrusa]